MIAKPFRSNNCFRERNVGAPRRSQRIPIPPLRFRREPSDSDIRDFSPRSSRRHDRDRQNEARTTHEGSEQQQRRQQQQREYRQEARTNEDADQQQRRQQQQRVYRQEARTNEDADQQHIRWQLDRERQRVIRSARPALEQAAVANYQGNHF